MPAHVAGNENGVAGTNGSRVQSKSILDDAKTRRVDEEAVLALQAMFIYATFMHAIFSSAPLSPIDILASILVGAVILPVVGLEKWWRRRYAGKDGRDRDRRGGRP